MWCVAVPGGAGRVGRAHTCGVWQWRGARAGWLRTCVVFSGSPFGRRRLQQPVWIRPTNSPTAYRPRQQTGCSWHLTASPSVVRSGWSPPARIVDDAVVDRLAVANLRQRRAQTNCVAWGHGNGGRMPACSDDGGAGRHQRRRRRVDAAEAHRIKQCCAGRRLSSPLLTHPAALSVALNHPGRKNCLGACGF